MVAIRIYYILYILKINLIKFNLIRYNFKDKKSYNISKNYKEIFNKFGIGTIKYKCIIENVFLFFKF